MQNQVLKDGIHYRNSLSRPDREDPSSEGRGGGKQGSKSYGGSGGCHRRQPKKAEEPLTGRASLPVRRSLWSYGHLRSRSAKLDPRAPRRRSRSQGCILAFDQGRLWASGTADREDAIPPNPGSGSRLAAAGPIPRGRAPLPTSARASHPMLF